MSKKKKSRTTQKNKVTHIRKKKQEKSKNTSVLLFVMGGIILLTAALYFLNSSSSNKQANNPGNSTQTASSVGASNFQKYCSGCHGPNGEGNKGPSLIGIKRSPSDVADFATNGAGEMPSFSSQLSKEQLEDIGRYISTLK